MHVHTWCRAASVCCWIRVFEITPKNTLAHAYDARLCQLDTKSASLQEVPHRGGRLAIKRMAATMPTEANLPRDVHHRSVLHSWHELRHEASEFITFLFVSESLQCFNGAFALIVLLIGFFACTCCRSFQNFHYSLPFEFFLVLSHQIAQKPFAFRHVLWTVCLYLPLQTVCQLSNCRSNFWRVVVCERLVEQSHLCIV